MRREWTKQEEQYMLKKYVRQLIKRTAQKLNRTEVSVKRKAAQLGINKHMDLFGIRTFAECFGVDNSVVLRWVQKFKMPVTIYRFDNRNHYDIDLDEFWKWAEEHKELINWSKYECGSLALEPDWVRSEKQMYTIPMTRENGQVKICKNLEVYCVSIKHMLKLQQRWDVHTIQLNIL